MGADEAHFHWIVLRSFIQAIILSGGIPQYCMVLSASAAVVALRGNIIRMKSQPLRQKQLLCRKLNRSKLLSFFATVPRCLVGMETCATANYWAREVTALGHEVRLMPT
jgi:hypothetical protein